MFDPCNLSGSNPSLARLAQLTALQFGEQLPGRLLETRTGQPARMQLSRIQLRYWINTKQARMAKLTDVSNEVLATARIIMCQHGNASPIRAAQVKGRHDFARWFRYLRQVLDPALLCKHQVRCQWCRLSFLFLRPRLFGKAAERHGKRLATARSQKDAPMHQKLHKLNAFDTERNCTKH